MVSVKTSATVPCELCGTRDSVEIVATRERDGTPLRVVMCPHCGLVWNDPRPSAEALEAYYREEYRLDYKGTVEPKPKHTLRAVRVAIARCRKLRAELSPGQPVLDLGAGGGEVVYVLQRLGFDARGLEPNEGYARFAREQLGVAVNSGRWQQASIPPGSLSAVTLFHVMEHLDRPLDAMRLIRGWLKTGGLLWIEVPNVEAVCQAPTHRFHRAHLYNFNEATLMDLGRRAGFDAVRAFTSSDGGNLTAVFRNSGGPAAEPAGIPGNADRIRGVLHRHTMLRHCLSAAPFVRPVRKLGQRISETIGVQGSKKPTDLMDRAIQQAIRSGMLSVLLEAGQWAGGLV